MWDHNVQVMVEGPGHVPLDQVAANMKVQQSICMGRSILHTWTIVTDIAPGYDHITAIGGAVRAMNGAAFLCYVTPAEHLALPNVDDVKQGIIASKIAAHAADIAKGIPGARDIDDKMADARQKLDWDAQYACVLTQGILQERSATAVVRRMTTVIHAVCVANSVPYEA